MRGKNPLINTNRTSKTSLRALPSQRWSSMKVVEFNSAGNASSKWAALSLNGQEVFKHGTNMPMRIYSLENMFDFFREAEVLVANLEKADKLTVDNFEALWSKLAIEWHKSKYALDIREGRMKKLIPGSEEFNISFGGDYGAFYAPGMRKLTHGSPAGVSNAEWAVRGVDESFMICSGTKDDLLLGEILVEEAMLKMALADLGEVHQAADTRPYKRVTPGFVKDNIDMAQESLTNIRTKYEQWLSQN